MNSATRRIPKATALACTAVMVLVVALFSVAPVGAAGRPGSVTAGQYGGGCKNPAGCFNTPGNLLISDQFNNRVIEVNPKTNKIVWSFGSGKPLLCDPGPGAIIGPNDAERLAGGLTLMAGTGIPAGGSPVNSKFSCVDNRVIVVNQAGHVVWQYGQAGVTGSKANELNVPVFATQLPNRNIMIVDQGNNRVIVVNRFTKAIVWSYGPASGPGALNNPNSAELLPNGHVLIADENNNRIIEVTHSGKIVWQYGSGKPKVLEPLAVAAFASRLSNGDTVITDSAHSRVVEIDGGKHVVWQHYTDKAKSSSSTPFPSNAVRLAASGSAVRTLISDQYNHRVLIVNASGKTLYQYGKTNVFGNGPGELDGPYTANSIGDYTGLTHPPSTF